MVWVGVVMMWCGGGGSGCGGVYCLLSPTGDGRSSLAATVSLT